MDKKEPKKVYLEPRRDLRKVPRQQPVRAGNDSMKGSGALMRPQLHSRLGCESNA